MRTAEEIPVVTSAEFLAAEEQGDRRHEYVSGRVDVMAGGTERHDAMTGAVYARVRPRSIEIGCRPFVANRLGRLGHSACHPDVMVVCGTAVDRRHEGD